MSPFAAAPPETARTVAVPETLPARNVTVHDPLCVRASAGSIVPMVVEKVTTVPFWTGVPADSVTVAVREAVPLSGTKVALAARLMVDPVGAVRGTLSQAPVSIASANGARKNSRRKRRGRDATIGRKG